MVAYQWIIACTALCFQYAQGQGTFSFPDNPPPTSEDKDDVLPGLESKYFQLLL